MERFIRSFLLTSTLLVVVIPSLTFGADCFLSIKYWPAPDHSRIVIDTEKPIDWNVVQSGDPNILVFEIESLGKKLSAQKISTDDDIVKEIRLSESSQDTITLQVHMVKPCDWNIFTLDKYFKNPAKLIIYISRPDLLEKEKLKRAKTKKLRDKGIRIVVIDPGHGAEDLGAIGRNGTKEKDVVLLVAKEMVDILNSKKGFRGALTRSDDYFIPLKERTNIAREFGADLFISLHADWTIKKDVTGTSFYCISLQGASDKGSELLAEKENLSDLIGGVPVQHHDNGDLQSILLDLVQTKNINDSLRFAGLAIGEMRKANKVKYDRPKQAGFAVLKSPNIPSVLVEIAYLSNREEERRLCSQEFRHKFAKALSEVAVNFLSRDSLQDQTHANNNEKRPDNKEVHIVRKGENLSMIASKYGVTVKALQRVNQLKNIDRIIPGKRILLP